MAGFIDPLLLLLWGVLALLIGFGLRSVFPDAGTGVIVVVAIVSARAIVPSVFWLVGKRRYFP